MNFKSTVLIPESIHFHPFIARWPFSGPGSFPVQSKNHFRSWDHFRSWVHFRSRIICGPGSFAGRLGLFAGRDHLRAGIICGPGLFAGRDHLRAGTICGPGSFASLYSTLTCLFLAQCKTKIKNPFKRKKAYIIHTDFSKLRKRPILM